MNTWRRLSNGLDTLVVGVTIALIAVMFSISLFAIGHNLLVGTPPSWSYSLTRLFVPWIAMLSLTVAFKRGEHVAMTVLGKRISSRAHALLERINLLMVGLFGAALFWYGIGFTAGSTQLFMISDFLQISHRWVVVSVPVCGAILCVHVGSGRALLTPADFGDSDL